MENTEIFNSKIDGNYEMDVCLFKKMMLLYNALEEGWQVKKQNKSYIFKKKHENKMEVYNDDFITNFIKSNMKI